MSGFRILDGDATPADLMRERRRDAETVNYLLRKINFLFKQETYSTSQTLSHDTYNWFFDTDGGALTATLPAGKTDATFRIVNAGDSGNLLTITPAAGEKLLGATSSFNLLDNEVLVIVYNKTKLGWY